MNDTARSVPPAGETLLDEAGADASPEDVITVVLTEDNRLVREGITSVLNRFRDIRVVASEPSEHEALLEESSPNVVLLDVGLENGDSMEIAQQIMEYFPEVHLIVMDLLPAADDIVEFISLGVSGFVVKDAALDEVVGTIRAVAAGVDVLPEAMTATLFSEMEATVSAPPNSNHHPCTARFTIQSAVHSSWLPRTTVRSSTSRSRSKHRSTSGLRSQRSPREMSRSRWGSSPERSKTCSRARAAPWTSPSTKVRGIIRSGTMQGPWRDRAGSCGDSWP